MSSRSVRLVDLATGESYDASEGVQVGRQVGTRVFPQYKNLSRAHFEIRVDGPICTIEDLGSANGTFLNDVRLTPKRRSPLKPGDRITAGNVRFAFRDENEPDSEPLGTEEITQIAEASAEASAAPILLDLAPPAAPIAPRAEPRAEADFEPVPESDLDAGRMVLDFVEGKSWHRSTRAIAAVGLLAILVAITTYLVREGGGLPHSPVEMAVRGLLAALIPFACGLFAHYVATRTVADAPVKIGLAALAIPAVAFAVGAVFVPLTGVERGDLENGLYRTCFAPQTRMPASCVASVKVAIAKGLPIATEDAARAKAFVEPRVAAQRAAAGAASPSPTSGEIRAPENGTPDPASADLSRRTSEYLEARKAEEGDLAAFRARVEDPGFCKMNWTCYVREVKKRPVLFASDAALIGELTIEYATRQKRSIHQCEAECSEKLSYELYSAIADLAESIVVPNLFAYQDYTATSAGARYIQLQEDAMLIKYFDGIRAHFEDRVASKMHVRADLDFVKLAARFQRLGEFPKTHGLLAGRLTPMEIDQVFRDLPPNPFRGTTEIIETLRAYQAAHPVGAP